MCSTTAATGHRPRQSLASKCRIGEMCADACTLHPGDRGERPSEGHKLGRRLDRSLLRATHVCGARKEHTRQPSGSMHVSARQTRQAQRCAGAEPARGAGPRRRRDAYAGVRANGQQPDGRRTSNDQILLVRWVAMTGAPTPWAVQTLRSSGTRSRSGGGGVPRSIHRHSHGARCPGLSERGRSCWHPLPRAVRCARHAK